MARRAMTRVLSVASECAPLIKTGGLADVAGALPGALATRGVEMRTLLPGYREVMAQAGACGPVAGIPDLFGGNARLLQGKAGGLDLFVLDAPHLYDRDGTIYNTPDRVDWPDNPERFAALSLVAARIAAGELGDWTPDILHGHDWQAGLAPYYLRRHFGAPVPSIMTIHNMAFHGIAPPEKREALGIAAEDFGPDGLEFYGNISALKAGLVHADKLTTVSPTYATELSLPEFGCGLDGLIRARAADLSGILNGIDTSVWDPATDAALARPFKAPRGKVAVKRALQAELDLPEAEGPLCVVISRLSEQKGLDLLLDALPALLDAGGQMALLGTGDAGLEDAWRRAAAHPHVAVRITYDEGLSHRFIAGGDAIVIPSRFEPCGLTQLYGLRYGTIPVVALTGGLADTVIPANAAAMAMGVATGLHVHPLTADALAQALRRLCALYGDSATFAKMQRRAMAQPVGWEVSAQAYAELYEGVLGA